ncbi:MAG: AAA family ATPase [Actinomycetota bacterium]|nr:AAA family ATPase [Actinomycetota bacterium]
MSEESVLEILHSKSVVILTGPGGVGKTSCAASIAIGAALSGINTAVVTIDPAKRLANALGLESIGNDPVEIPMGGAGSLSAVMLDADATFDALIKRYAKSQEQVEAILANKVYQNLTQYLSGIQEYMAMEKIFELHNDPRFDLLIVDTPPSANALDFLDAPRRLVSFLDNKVFKIIMSPSSSFLKPISFATRAVLKTISKVVGAEIVDEAVAFFKDFEGMEEGFRARAIEVGELLKSEKTTFFLVTSPRTNTIVDAKDFGEKLISYGFSIARIISNREVPSFSGDDHESGALDDLVPSDLDVLSENLKKIELLRNVEQKDIDEMAFGLRADGLIHVADNGAGLSSIEDLAHLASSIISPN